ncbi:MAG: LysM peptidoglycan-binding domain-containing protein [bacterium]|nr:LysM peptidoglycan-binding domain-containing protein [bacterium]
MRKYIFTAFFFILLTGCLDIATKDDIDAIKEKVSNLEDDFYATVKQIGDKFTVVENDYNQKDEKIKKSIDEVSDKILVLSNEITSLKNETKTIKGKIDETKFENSEKIKNLNEEFIQKSIEIRKDIESIKKDIEGAKLLYNDLALKTSSFHQNLSDAQTSVRTDVINLRDSQMKIVDTLQNLAKKIEQIDEKINTIDKKFEHSITSLLEELTRHESEIYQLKKYLSESEKKMELPISPSVKPILKTGKEKYHIVQKGEYLTKIAKKYNTSVSEIKKINNLQTDNVYPGQKLLIP